MAIPRQHRAKVYAAHQERLRQVAALRLAGVRDQATIAQRLGVSAATMSRDFAEVNARWRIEAAADIEAVMGQDLERLDAMLLGIWQEATKGRHQAIDRALHILERRAAIYGYDAPKRQEITGKNGEPMQLEVGSAPARERLKAKVSALSTGRTLPVPQTEGQHDDVA